MFANRLAILLRTGDEEHPVPKAWLDQFFMRNFTGCNAFNETLPVRDGLLEAGSGVAALSVREHFEKWLRGRKMIPAEAELVVRDGAPRRA